MERMKILADMLLGAILLVGICVYMQPTMSECPTSHPGIICPMHDTNALSFWQQAVVLSRRVMELAAFAFVILFVWFIMAKGRSDPGTQHIFHNRLYLVELPFSYLQELFSQGILHPKIF